MKKLGFVGAGNMASALIKGLLETKRYRARDLWASDADPRQCRRLARTYGVTAASDNPTLVHDSAVVLLAVKPQIIDAVLAEIRPAVDARRHSRRSSRT